MSQRDYYPAGAYSDPNAPWNEVDHEEDVEQIRDDILNDAERVEALVETSEAFWLLVSDMATAIPSNRDEVAVIFQGFLHTLADHQARKELPDYLEERRLRMDDY